MLKNKAGLWKSDEDDTWVFKNRGNDLISIKKNSVVLEATSDGRVIERIFEKGKDDQLWKKEKPDNEGYFTLESYSEVPKVITATSESDLRIQGNITLR